MSAECIHGLGPVAACVICNGREKAERDERRRVGHMWGALFPGTCAVCGGEFVANEGIGRNDRGEYVGDCCAVVAS